MSTTAFPTNPHPAAARHDFYAGIHKALRAFMGDTLATIGRMDVTDAEDFDAATEQLDALLALLRAHLDHENVFVHPLLEAAQAGSAARIGGEHVEHEQAIAALCAALADLRALPGEVRAQPALELYRALALFVAENFEHMQYEEREHGAVLCAHYSDAELLAIHDRIVAVHTPAEVMQVMRWMLPYLSHAERCEVLLGMRANAPAPAFDAVLGVAREYLRPRDWLKLCGALTTPVTLAA